MTKKATYLRHDGLAVIQLPEKKIYCKDFKSSWCPGSCLCSEAEKKYNIDLEQAKKESILFREEDQQRVAASIHMEGVRTGKDKYFKVKEGSIFEDVELGQIELVWQTRNAIDYGLGRSGFGHWRDATEEVYKNAFVPCRRQVYRFAEEPASKNKTLSIDERMEYLELQKYVDSCSGGDRPMSPEAGKLKRYLELEYRMKASWGAKVSALKNKVVDKKEAVEGERKPKYGNSAHPFEDELLEEAKEEAKKWSDPSSFLGGVGYGSAMQSKLLKSSPQEVKPETMTFERDKDGFPVIPQGLIFKCGGRQFCGTSDNRGRNFAITELPPPYQELSEVKQESGDSLKRKPNKTLRPGEFEKAIEDMDFDLILDNQLRQVRWLYKNHNKLTMVYDEKLVRLMIQRLQYKVKELEEQLKPKGI